MERKEGRGMRPGAPTSQEGTRPKEQGSLKTASETGQDYSDMLTSIRADQDVDTFAKDLRRNKEQLLSFVQKLIRKPRDTRADRGVNLAVGIYLDYVLKQHVCGSDPFSSKRSGDEGLQELREALVSDLATRGAFRWLKTHLDSQAAEEVSQLGTYATSDSHRRLLQEMWPLIRHMERLPKEKR
jgi:hypothetical protein